MIISVCSRCKPQKNASFFKKSILNNLRLSLKTNIQIQEVSCMAACSRPISVAITEAGKASYLFGDISSDEHVLALIEFIAQYQNNATGWTSSVERPNALRSKTVARIPGGIQINNKKKSLK